MRTNYSQVQDNIRVLKNCTISCNSHDRNTLLFLFLLSSMNTLSRFQSKFRYGFTLIELLLVIGIIAILASIVIVAINPTKQLGDARDAQRRSDVNTILNAVYQYAIDNNGSLPADITTTTQTVCKSDDALIAACNTMADSTLLAGLTGSYLVAMPADPLSPSGSASTMYTIVKDSRGRVTVTAPVTEQASETISVTR